VAWDRHRSLAQERADWMRQQAPFGVAMASQEEISYTGLRRLKEQLEGRFVITAEGTGR